ncbi:putative TetR-family transcriptional regulator [Pseudooceanicola batsensis HTCC2597]|uniref:Putative TetR-family transcriptional regulator n=1 Tax=Pseudooceanicola batsensis (strain ATCC BAA-863 / DSM 15984 / KCTC 12145 / HTCC2597) TaxID=252305 RepID=A3U195_PSEBH|nr:TetR/AcrR family transcriptional regulator [Pseudooceanicola batsensis]EAQ02078.1 putative TetR-family transcriptional regulator [Pseudooceanicola batsensis HTCC2597]
MRDRILDATAKLLVEHGTQASMSKIAGQAEVAIGSLYNHFASKEDLIRAVYERLAEEVTTLLVEGDDPAAAPEVRLERYLDNYIDFIWSDPERAILFEYLSNVPLLPAEDVIVSFRGSSDFIGDILQSLRDAGWLMHGDLFLMGGFIGGAIRNTLKWNRTYGRDLTVADRTQIKTMCLH